MNLQTEISLAEIARLMQAAEMRGKTFGTYSQALRWILKDWLESQGFAVPEFEQEAAVEYLKNYGRFGLSVKQYGREDKKQERVEEAYPNVPRTGGIKESIMRNKALFDAVIARTAAIDAAEAEGEDADEVDPDLAELAQAAQNAAEAEEGAKSC